MKVTEVGTKENRIPCCGKGYPQRERAEHEGYTEALTDKRVTENNNTDANSQTLLKAVDTWLRRRIRMYIWKRWKRIRTRYSMLRKFGKDHTTRLLCSRVQEKAIGGLPKALFSTLR